MPRAAPQPIMALEIYRALLSAGIGEEQSRAVAQAMDAELHKNKEQYATAGDLQHFVTKDDLNAVKDNLNQKISDAKDSSTNLRDDVSKWSVKAVLTVITVQMTTAFFLFNILS